MTPEIANSGTDPAVRVQGVIVADNGDLVALGPTASITFSFQLPLEYEQSLESLKEQVIPMIQSTYQVPGFEARVVVFPLL